MNDLPPPPSGRSGWPWQAAELTENTREARQSENWPKITVVTPSFNQGEFLEETIRSVLLQGYPNLEYFVIDGGSSDSSLEVIKKYEEYLSGWLSEPDSGQSDAINKGFARSSGDIHAYLASDDIYEPDALRTCAAAYNGGHRWIVGRVRCVQEGVGYWPFPVLPGNSFTRWFMSCPISQPGVFWSADLHREAGDFRDDLHFALDYEYWMRLRFVHNARPFFLEKPIAVYRFHPTSKTVARNESFANEIRSTVRHYEKLLSRWQRLCLVAARRYRRASNHGSVALSLYRSGALTKAFKHLAFALAIWPPIILSSSAMKAVLQSTVKREIPTFPPIWPDSDGFQAGPGYRKLRKKSDE